MVLTEQHITMLESLTAKFRAVGTNRREKIVENAADHIKSSWAEDMEFDREAVINVCGRSAKLDRSHISSAYL
jgi:hypothetical protein